MPKQCHIYLYVYFLNFFYKGNVVFMYKAVLKISKLRSRADEWLRRFVQHEQFHRGKHFRIHAAACDPEASAAANTDLIMILYKHTYNKHYSGTGY